MGMGHVPTGTLRQERKSDDVPRRQYRRTRTKLRSVEPQPLGSDVGSFGETLAAQFLKERGAHIVHNNLRVGRGEIDLVVRLATELVAVEVKTAACATDPIFHFDEAKQGQVRSLAEQRGIHRVDYVGVVLAEEGVTVRWLPRVC